MDMDFILTIGLAQLMSHQFGALSLTSYLLSRYFQHTRPGVKYMEPSTSTITFPSCKYKYWSQDSSTSTLKNCKYEYFYKVLDHHFIFNIDYLLRHTI